MIRALMLTSIFALGAACTGPANDGSRVRDSSPRIIPEPTTPGVHVSGHVIIGVSTVN